jgi:hypothetical protein
MHSWHSGVHRLVAGCGPRPFVLNVPSSRAALTGQPAAAITHQRHPVPPRGDASGVRRHDSQRHERAFRADGGSPVVASCRVFLC